MQNDIIVAGIILFFVLWALVERKQLVTARYTIVSTRLPKQLDATNFIVLADLHNNTFGKNNERLIKRIDKLAPEFIIVAGDMVNKKDNCYPSNAFTLLEQLSKNHKIYYAYGNHEQKIERYMDIDSDVNSTSDETNNMKKACSTWVEFKERLIATGVIFLSNDSIIINKNTAKLRITGISIEHKYFERNKTPEMENDYLDKLIGESSKEEYQLLIAHNPIYFMNYVKWGADLVISGHLHGGMVRLPGVGGILSPQAKFFPKYNSGTYVENGQHLVVSRGLGSHSIMPRLFNIPEVVLVSLKSK
jgi:predicted MPP superfamily phosphohydrolase